MSQSEKRLEAMRRNPGGDWTIDDVKVVARWAGLWCAPPRGGGSHYTIRRLDGGTIFTIPYRKPIKPKYITILVATIDRMRPP